MNWLKNRLLERTTLDGAVLILVGAAFIVLGPIAKLVAYASIAYGAYTIIKKG